MPTTEPVIVSRRAIQWALAVIESDPRWTDDPNPLIEDAPGGSDWQWKMYQELKAALTATKDES